MPNPWTGKGNPYTRKEVIERLRATLKKGNAIIAGGAGTGISAKFIERGGADLIIIYNSGRFRMMGHGSTAGMMAYGDANAIAMEIGEFEVLPVVEECPVICGVHATDPRRRMWHWLGQVKEMGFSGVNNFPTHTIVDGHFRGVLEETGMSVKKEYEMIALARRMDLFSIVYVGSPEEAIEMAKAGADAIIAHVGTTVGGSIGVKNALVSWDHTIKTTQAIIDGHFRGVLEETGMSVKKEYEMVALARRMDLFSVVYVGSPEEAVEMAKAGADAIIAHVGTTVGGSIGVKSAVKSWDFTIKRTQEIIDAATRVRKDIFFLCHGGPINTPQDAERVINSTTAVGFVGATSLERMGIEESLTNLTRKFKSLKVPKRGKKK